MVYFSTFVLKYFKNQKYEYHIDIIDCFANIIKYLNNEINNTKCNLIIYIIM